MLNLEKNAWKGIGWQLFIFWPVTVYFIVTDQVLIENFWVILGLFFGTALWIIGLFRLIKILRKPFGDN